MIPESDAADQPKNDTPVADESPQVDEPDESPLPDLPDESPQGDVPDEGAQAYPLDESAPAGEPVESPLPDEQGESPRDATPPEVKPAGWETYVNAPVADPRLESPPGNGWYRTGIAFAVLGLIVPLVFGPAALVVGLRSRDKRHPRALVPIILGILVTAYGVVYYWLVTTGGVR